MQAQKDSLPKIHHAEPLYMDLIRDLGARRGERELNVGGCFQKNNYYTSYSGFIEYEFALFNRLGIEIETPFSFYQAKPVEDTNQPAVPKNRMEGIKVSAQYTFLVAPALKTSMAVGYTNQLAFHSFKTVYSENKIAKGNIYAPFFVAAKNWGKNINTLIITGPVYEQKFSGQDNTFGYQFHASVFHMFLKNNFVGIELNHVYLNNSYSTILHPQIKYKVSPALAIGFVTAIPINGSYETTAFIRIIYEPKRK